MDSLNNVDLNLPCFQEFPAVSEDDVRKAMKALNVSCPISHSHLGNETG
jgi:hypothetical protein